MKCTKGCNHHVQMPCGDCFDDDDVGGVVKPPIDSSQAETPSCFK